MKLFVLDIGNTNTRYGIIEDGVLISCADHPTKDLENLEIPKGMPVAGASVVPEANSKIKTENAFWINYKHDLGVDLRLVDAEKLGADRIANLVALAETVELPALIIDCGTAVTGELLSKDRVFLGGPIAPGRLLQRKSLSSYTAQLPFIPVDNRGSESFGSTTEDAILLGTDMGIVGAVKEFINVAKNKLDSESLEVLIGGGDCDILLNNIDGVKRAPNDITLRGIAAIWERNNK